MFVDTILASAEVLLFLSTAFIRYEPVLAGTIALSHFLLGQLTKFEVFSQFASDKVYWYLSSLKEISRSDC